MDREESLIGLAAVDIKGAEIGSFLVSEDSGGNLAIDLTAATAAVTPPPAVSIGRARFVAELACYLDRRRAKRNNAASGISYKRQDIQDCLAVLEPYLPEETAELLAWWDSASDQIFAISENLAKPLTIEQLLLKFEDTISQESANREGAFYTPIDLAYWMTRDAIRSAGKTRQIKILDPACGSGIFLLAAFRTVAAEDPTKATEVLTGGIFGVDRNPAAVLVCRVGLICAALEIGLEKHLPRPYRPQIEVGNSLIDSTGLNSNQQQQFQAFDWTTAFPGVLESGGFDIILGNPPYGLSRDIQIEHRENQLLKDRYAQFRSGKVNKYLLFLARGYQLLAAKGVLWFVVPNAWLGIAAGRPIRKLFLAERSLHSVVSFRTPIFRVPSVEAVCVKLVKAGECNSVRIEKAASVSEIEARQIQSISAAACLAQPDAMIPLSWNSRSSAILSQIDASSVRLNSGQTPFQAAIALQAYATGKGEPRQTIEQVRDHVFHATEKLGLDYYPYAEGRDFGRYTFNWSGKYLRWGKFLAEPQKLSRFSGPRIALREILGPPEKTVVATFLEDTVLYNKSVLHIMLEPEGTRDQLLALLGVLNSRLGSLIILQRGRKSQRRLFPKLVGADLADFPVAKQLLAKPELLARLVEQRLKPGISESSQQSLDEQLEALVAEFYGLTEIVAPEDCVLA